MVVLQSTTVSSIFTYRMMFKLISARPSDERDSSPPPTRSYPRELEGNGRLAPTHAPRTGAVPIPNPRPSSGKALSPTKLAQRERKFKEMLADQEYYEEITSLDGDEAQKALDSWQLVRPD